MFVFVSTNNGLVNNQHFPAVMDGQHFQQYIRIARQYLRIAQQNDALRLMSKL